jgi:hypothetical protein
MAAGIDPEKVGLRAMVLQLVMPAAAAATRSVAATYMAAGIDPEKVGDVAAAAPCICSKACQQQQHLVARSKAMAAGDC